MCVRKVPAAAGVGQVQLGLRRRPRGPRKPTGLGTGGNEPLLLERAWNMWLWGRDRGGMKINRGFWKNKMESLGFHSDAPPIRPDK